jgi:hypothetical protein
VSSSAEVVPELRQYERATTTLTNAFIQPPIYALDRADRGLNCAAATLSAMRDLLVGMASPDGTRL